MGIALDDVFTFSPALLLNVRYGYARFIEQNEARIALDAADAPAWIVRSPHEITVAQERWPDLRFNVMRERGGTRFALAAPDQ